MRCRIVVALISDYIDGSTNENLAEEIKTHISNCSRCSENLEFTTKIVNSLHCLKQQQISINCWPDIKDKLHLMQERRSWYKSRPFQMIGAYGAAIILLLVITIGIFNAENQSSKTKKYYIQANALDNKKNFMLQHVSSYKSSPLDDADTDLISADMMKSSYVSGNK